MRVPSLLGLLLALVIVGVLAKKQFAAAPALPASEGATQPADARAQSRQVQQQVQQSLDAAAQQRARQLDGH